MPILTQRILIAAGISALTAFTPGGVSASEQFASSDTSMSSGGASDVFISEMEALINREGAVVHHGDLAIPEGTEIRGPVVVIGGLCFVNGTVAGDLIAINGSVSLQPDAVIAGDLRVTGGVIYASRRARVLGRQSAVNTRLIIRDARPGQFRLEEERPEPVVVTAGFSGWRFSRVRGHDVALTAGIKPGTGRRFPVLSSTLYAPTIRNNHGYIDYRISLEQSLFERRPLKLEVSGYKNTDTPDGWHVPSIRKSAIAYLTREDYYNYHTRFGFSASATQRLTRHVSVGMAYVHDKFYNLPEHAPFTLFRRNDRFRVNPVIDEGRIHSLIWRLNMDTRNAGEQTANAWYFDGEIERAVPALGSDFGYTRFDMTLRRYNAWRGHHVNVRAKIAGSRGALPLQRVYVLGASGGLRGFGAFEYTGDRLLVANVDYRLPVARLRQKAMVPWLIEGLVFFDTGTAFFSKASGRNSRLDPAVRDRIYPHVDLPLPDGYGDLRSDLGAGVSVSSRLIDLTLTIGQNLHTTSAKPRVSLFLHRDVF